jgi:hypothetical protein
MQKIDGRATEKWYNNSKETCENRVLEDFSGRETYYGFYTR